MIQWSNHQPKKAIVIAILMLMNRLPLESKQLMHSMQLRNQSVITYHRFYYYLGLSDTEIKPKLFVWNICDKSLFENYTKNVAIGWLDLPII